MLARPEVASGRWSSIVGAVVLAAILGCSSTPKPKAIKLEAPRFSKRLDPSELLPADLDLVVRVDLGRMRDGLGPLATDQLAARALERRGDPMLRGLIGCADVLWVGLRVAEIDAADHVAIVEGKDCDVRADTSDWKKGKSANAELTIFDRISSPERGGTSRIILVADRAVVLVSPAETASVDRLLRDGPDPKRGEPKAEGIVSLDMRGQRLPPALEQKYPSIARVFSGIDRVRASGQLADGGVELEAEVRGKTAGDGKRTLRFLSALRDNVESDAARLLLSAVRLEQVDETVRIRWVVPSKVVLGAFTDTPAPADASAP